jgi:4-hydroxybenzoate polyprenyltransferase
VNSDLSLSEYLYDRAFQYWHLMRFHKPIGIFLLLWPTLWALWIAGKGSPKPLVAAIMVAGVVIMRAAGCVINDYADRQFDPLVSRTRDRPIAAGRVTKNEALGLFAVLCLIAFALVLMLNTMTILLSFVGAFLAASYPFMKRYTHLPQIYLGLAFGWAVPMAFAAQSESLPQTAWLLYIATIFWALAYDTMYAMVDREEDLRIGVKSTAILFGDLDRFFIGIIQGLVFLTLYVVGAHESFGVYYHAGLLVCAGFAVYQQILIYGRTKEGCFRAFLNNNWFGAAVFLGILLQYRAG